MVNRVAVALWSSWAVPTFRNDGVLEYLGFFGKSVERESVVWGEGLTNIQKGNRDKTGHILPSTETHRDRTRVEDKVHTGRNQADTLAIL
jgi:hypothetical protein